MLLPACPYPFEIFYHVTPYMATWGLDLGVIMAIWQPHLGAREGLEPLGSDLEGS